MKHNCYKILEISVERVRDELMKMLKYPKPSIGFELMHQCGLLLYTLPELEMAFGVGQNRFHADDVARHTLLTIDALDPRFPFDRWCALLHDLGKVPNKMYRKEKSDYVFYGHQYASKRMGKTIMKRLKFSNKEIDQACTVVENHMYNLKTDLSESATRRFLRKLGRENVAHFLRMRMADRKGNRFNNAGYEEGIFHFVRTLRRIEKAEDALSLRDLLVSGNDLKNLGLQPGPIFSEILNSILEEVLDEPARNDRDWLQERARQYANNYKRHGKLVRPPLHEHQEPE
jgi:poly(A) polymerase/tRNA nucleotidyltransferase (CCA-adding enzyme)